MEIFSCFTNAACDGAVGFGIWVVTIILLNGIFSEKIIKINYIKYLWFIVTTPLFMYFAYYVIYNVFTPLIY